MKIGESALIAIIFLSATLFASTPAKVISNYKEKTFFELDSIGIKNVKKLNKEGQKYCILFQGNKQIYCDFKGLDKINIVAYTELDEVKITIKNSDFVEEKEEVSEVGEAMVKKYRELKKNFAILSNKNEELIEMSELAKKEKLVAEQKLKSCTASLLDEINRTTEQSAVNQKKIDAISQKFEVERSGLIAVMTGNKKYKNLSEQSTINQLIDELEELKKSQKSLQKDNLKLLKKADADKAEVLENDKNNIGSGLNEENFKF